ncbi:MAG: dTMP kinase [Kiritimatiellae bacterium]|jgi:dTMP kinase|nr:dTMP kinase [Kiritimatiellia bacterium]MDD2349822.1 dTMP kinase [Kiritimatiellia bacterium]MDD3584035.1 dTMP kinase [Kiritimatiellia bacterium]HHU15880.1 dTMP kinase [Lentisphaerota bacterium]HON46682.1 dTMP kinase [Kiritimatiellia bacterium]
MNRGVFITFEGPEASGKSTHIRLLAERLRERGITVTLTREPGGTPLCEAIRRLLQHDGSGEAPVPQAEVLLFLASRAQHVARVIEPALARGEWVLCDRFSDSTLAYQGYGRGFDLAQLRAIDAFATRERTPDLTVLLDVTPETSRQRLRTRQVENAAAPDRIEREADAFHARLRAGFLELAATEPERFVVLTTEREPDEVAAEILAAIDRRFFKGGVGTLPCGMGVPPMKHGQDARATPASKGAEDAE